jgi:hypothetical protein
MNYILTGITYGTITDNHDGSFNQNSSIMVGIEGDTFGFFNIEISIYHSIHQCR